MRLSRPIVTYLSAFILLLAPGDALAGGGIGCCTIGTTCSNDVGSQTCEMSGGTFVDGGTCTSTPIGTCDPPPTPTPDTGCCEFADSCADNAILMTCVLSQGTYVSGGVCVPETGFCQPPPTPTATPNTGCCEFGGSCSDDAILMTCVLSQGDYFPGEVCDTATGVCMTAPTPTPTATPTSTAAPDGSSCTTSTQCTSTFCVNGFCCDTACDGATERCDVAGSEGACLALNATPAASTHGLVAMALLLCGIAALTIRRVTG